MAAGLATILSCDNMAAVAVTPAVDTAAAERMVAASPERERYRAWLACADNIAGLVIAQAGDRAKTKSMVQFGCEEEDSRLTGALIAKYGYARGNAAVAALKNAADARYAARMGQRDNPPRPLGYVETTPDGWEVKRLQTGCMAMRLKRNGLNSGGSITALERSMGVAKLYFILAGDDANVANIKLTRSFDTDALVSGENDRFNVRLTFTPRPYRDGIMYEVLARDNLITQLDQGSEVQIFVPGGMDDRPSWPTRYPVKGIAAAWAAVERCGLG